MRIPAVLAAATFVACAPPFSTDRPDAPGTFGERVVTLTCKRLAFEANPSDVSGSATNATCDGSDASGADPAVVTTIATDRERLASAIDAVVTPDQTDPLQAYLTTTAILGLYDDGTMSSSSVNLAGMFAELGGSGDAMDAFARMGGHLGYRTPATSIGPNQAVLVADSFPPILDQVLPVIIPGGSAEPEWNATVGALSATLADASPPTDAPDARLSVLLRDFMLTARGNISEGSNVTPLVQRDGRGVAMVTLGSGGQVPAPFADADGDGAADVDALGRFVDASGTPISVPTPFPTANDTATRDAAGRALDGSGAPLYVYRDLGTTVFGALSHDLDTLLDPAKGTALNFARGASLLMGPRVPATKTFDNGVAYPYSGYDRTQAPLLDMSYGFTTLLRDPNVQDLLALTQQLFSDAHVSTTARLAEDTIDIARAGDAHTEAQIVPDAPFWDDMRPILQRIAADPKLVAGLLDALKDPNTVQLATRFREFMTYSDQFNIDDNTQAVTGQLATSPDRSKPDSAFNRSLFQRLAEVIADSQVNQCNKANAVVREPTTGLPLDTYAACSLFQIDNLAVFYLQAIVFNKDASGNIICESNAGAFAATQVKPTADQCSTIGAGWRPQRKANFNYQWGTIVQTLLNTQGGDAFLESQSTIVGFRTHPTPEALNRVLFKPTTPKTVSDTADPIVDKDGDLMKTKLAGTLPVWELNNFYTEVRPVLQVFADNNQEQLFVDLMTVLHKHWSSAASTDTQHTTPGGKNYTYGSAVETYEPLIIEVLNGDIYPALLASTPELTAISVNGKPFSQVAANSLNFLTSPLPGLTNRLGATTSTTSNNVAVTTLSPWQLLADAYVAKRARLATLGAQATVWTDTGPQLVDLLFRADRVGATTTWQFRNPHIAAVTLATTQYLSARIAAHDVAGDRVKWLATDLPNDLEEKVTHPLFAAVVDLIEKFTQLGAPRAALEGLLFELFDETNHAAAFNIMRTSNADLMQIAPNDDNLIPLAHVIGGLIGPGKSYLPTQLVFLHKLHVADTAGTLQKITEQLFQPYNASGDPGVCSISAIADGIGDVDRVVPSSEPAWSGADYAATFAGVADFLTEEQHGLPRFIAIVQGRSL